ncbi:MAG: 16S rRNA (uracil(1498)-N(3))-methyltransferase [Actinobacteria bacterium]|nr:16S rRNA (uracil(1498)-N(3))-methyltransferase [Actinomycetota bacterium]
MLTLFFVPDLPIQVGARYSFNSEDANHAIKVLRIEVGEIFQVSDGNGGWANVQVNEVTKRSLETTVLEVGRQEPLEIKFTVVQALPKSDRAKEAVELLTEAGADVIVPWLANRSISRTEVISKFATTAREASKQSRRLFIPQLHETVKEKGVIELIKNADLALVFHESAQVKLSEIITPETKAKNVVIVIGPEGGITEEELATFAAAGAHVAGLGRPILRSAHAGLAALSAVNSLLKVF